VTSRARRWLAWAFGALAIVVVSLGVTGYILVRPSRIKPKIERVATEHLHLVTTIGDLSIHLFPRAGVEGHRLELRLPDHPELPPFVAIDHFTVGSTTPVALVTSMLRGHIGTVHVDGMKIVVPPGKEKHAAFHPGDDAADRPDPAAGRSPDQSNDTKKRIVVDHLVSHDAELTILRSKPGDAPLVYAIHELEMDDLGFDRAMPFRTRLTNAVPTGEVTSNGSVGPWQDEPADLPLQGDYQFTNAQLGTIHGIGGNLTSTGTYEGTLTRIRVVGESTTPDFNLDMGGHPIPLTAKFTTVVDGTNGSTTLESVDARLFETPIHVTGQLTNLAGPTGFDMTFDAKIVHGRIEDVLMLVMDDAQPPFTGDLSLTTNVRLPPGKSRVQKRLELRGTFDLERTKFASGEVQQKLRELSRRSQGKDEDEKMSRVLSDLGGRFSMRAGMLHLQGLSFAVPGARVRLDGTYELATGAIDFAGELRMQATVSQAVGGFKSIFLKPFDFIFRKDGAGAVIPIKITGTRQHPEFGLRMGGGKD
jgi:hypothetical protein